jgi:5'-3' exonuclease
VKVYLIDGTYELFRQFFGRPPAEASDGREVGAARGVLLSVVSLLSQGVTHVGVATDHVIESFRNDLWAGYKTGAEVDPVLKSQFQLLEDALESLGVRVWPMVELEADDALASAAAVAAGDPLVGEIVICTPDKDLAQCVVDRRVVQLDRRTGVVTDEQGVWDRYGVAPASIPDWLALVGDSADGFPGLAGWGKQSASGVLAHYGHLESIPGRVEDWDPEVRRHVRSAPKLAARLAAEREHAELFRLLATLRVEPTLLGGVGELRWRGPERSFEDMCRHLREPRLYERVAALAGSRDQPDR